MIEYCLESSIYIYYFIVQFKEILSKTPVLSLLLPYLSIKNVKINDILIFYNIIDLTKRILNIFIDIINNKINNEVFLTSLTKCLLYENSNIIKTACRVLETVCDNSSINYL